MNRRLRIAYRIRPCIFDRRGLHLRLMKWLGKLFVKNKKK
jgi:hypothetical protein